MAVDDLDDPVVRIGDRVRFSIAINQERVTVDGGIRSPSLRVTAIRVDDSGRLEVTLEPLRLPEDDEPA